MAKTSGGIRNIKPTSTVERARQKILSVLDDIRKYGFSRMSPFKVGGVEKRMSDFAKRNGITLSSKDVYMSSSGIAHAIRDSKQSKGIAVSEKELSEFPKRMRKMELYYDTRTRNFTYTDGEAKIRKYKREPWRGYRRPRVSGSTTAAPFQTIMRSTTVLA